MALDGDVSGLPLETQFKHAELCRAATMMTREQLEEALRVLSASHLNYQYHVNQMLRQGLVRGIPLS